MGLHKLTAGDGYTYLTRQVAVHDATDRGHTGLGEYYSEKGESPGRWYGSGLAALDVAAGAEVTEAQMRNLFGEGRHPDAERLENQALDQSDTVREAERASRLGRPYQVYDGASVFRGEVARRFTDHNHSHGLHWRTPIPDEVRARIRSQVAVEMFTAEHGRAPLDDRERAGFLATASRQQTTAVAGYDLTFTPVKSVSALWAVAQPAVAKQVEEAHHAAVHAALGYLEEEVLFTRRGRGGVQQVKATGLIAAVFTHRDSRSGDPNLHSHVAISNKVQDATGAWLAVDGRVLYKANVTLSETYNTLIEAELVARLGVQFAPRDATSVPGEKRAVREIVGVDDRLAAGWSSRSRAIEGRRRELAVKFQTDHGRPPSPIESIALAQRATLETRQAKHAPRSEAEQRTVWRAEATRMLGSPDAIGVMVHRTLGRGTQPAPVSDAWIEETARLVVDTVQANRATWQTWHLRAEAQRRVREHEVPLQALGETVDEIVEHAVTDHSLAFNDPDPLTATGQGPDALRRADGVSVYVQHESRLFTSRAVVAAEHDLLAAARQGGGRRISDVRVGIALAETAANGITPNAAQAGLVRELATSGARLQLALAPAGTGKTLAMEVLARAWADGGGQVVGLAPSAVAAAELRTALNTGMGDDSVCDTLSKLVYSIQPSHEIPAWVEAIDKRTLVVIDEAAMASTIELSTAVRFVLARGGSVRLVGDDRQLAAVAAGGVLRDIAATVGAVTLTEVRRFADPAEAAATLAVRDGDPAALGFYADHGRIHVGDLAGAADQAYRAWTTDTAAGKQSLLLAPTRELVAELNTRARTDRLARNPQAVSAPAVRLGDGTLVSAGDTIISRRNHRGLRISSTDWVKNGDRWTVTNTHADGSITAIHHALRSRVRLPRDYVRDGHVQLGYATTIHGAQGTTVETSHTVLTGQEDRALFYVAVSRGRGGNHVYLAVGNDGDPHHLIRPETLIPPTALDQLTQILGRDSAPTSATTALRQVTDPAHQLQEAAARYHDALTFAAERLLGPVALHRLETAADLLCVDLTQAPAWPTLRSHLALLSLDHANDPKDPDGLGPVTLLRQAIAQGGLDDAADPAAVIDSRLQPDPRGSGEHGDARVGVPGLVPWLPAIPARLAEDLDWGAYLSERQARVHYLAARVQQTSQTWTSVTAPVWAQHMLAPQHEQLRDAVAVWRAVQGVSDTDPRPTGPRQIGTPGRHQGVLARAARAALGAYPFTQRDWYQALPDSLREDPWITVLCQRLTRLERAGLPVSAYLHDALTQPRPLPDQQPAAALWWRVCAHLGPAAVHERHAGDLLRPPWLPTLAGLLPHHPAEQLAASSAWPALVAAVDEAASRHHWDPGTLLSTAAHALPADLRPADLCDALVLRVAILTDPPDDPDTEQPDPPEPENLPPDDLDQAPPPTWLENTTADVESDRRHAPAGPHDSPAIPAIPQPATAAVARERIVELHDAALEFYAAMYPRSWAPGYLCGRLGSDLTDLRNLTGASRVSVGYAPPGPTSLLRHLLTTGATEQELLAAGLVKQRDRGDLIDTFRDRLLMPIRDLDGAVVGLVGRRNPTRDDDDYAGPKYLNTRTTAAYTKGHHLFGLSDAGPALTAGAVPVLVEGPLDAWAITLASNGTAVGLAALGTALTPTQIELLRPHFADTPHRVAVATDADPAGWRSAQTHFWALTAAGADPTQLALPTGRDPAQLYEHSGAAAVLDALTRRRPLGDAMIDQHLHDARDWSAAATRLTLVRHAAQIIAARPIETWDPAMKRLNSWLHLSPGILEHEVLHHSATRDLDRADYATRQITGIRTRTQPPRTTPKPPDRASRDPHREDPWLPGPGQAPHTRSNDMGR